MLDAADRPGGRVATDMVDGFRLDRGFQVLNTVYPALRATADLAANHLDGPVVERFLRPFLSGVLGERELMTSAAHVRLVWRCFALGTIAVPSAGVGALPAQLADALPEKVLRTGRRITRVEPGRVAVDGDALSAHAIVVATDPRSAAELLPGLGAPALHTLTTYRTRRRRPPRPSRCCTSTRPAARSRTPS